MATLFDNVISGVVDDNPLSSGATTLNSSALANLSAVTGSDIMWITLDPDASGGAPEIVKVTAHTASATSATIVRAQQGTTARAHLQNTVWKHAVTASDLDDFLTTVATADIVDSAVTTAKIADLNVTTGKLAADAVTGAKIADDQIDSEHYVAGSIDAEHLASDSVTTAKILDANVTLAKMAANSVDSDQYVDGSIDTAHYADASVTAAKLASEAWTSTTPAIDQGASTNIAKTVAYAKYARFGRLIVFSFSIQANAAGTAGSVATVALPVTAASTSGVWGAGTILDLSTGTTHPGTWQGNSTTSASLAVADSALSGWGVAPNLALANGDFLNGTIIYEAAS